MPNQNQSIIPLIFTKDYWKHAVNPNKKLLLLTVTALLMALNIAISSFFIPVGENLRIYFSFIPTSLACMIGGPITAICYGFGVDILGTMIHPTGAFFPGYTLSSILGALIYSLFFFRQRITVLRIFLCKLSINVFVNIMLGSLWSYMLFGKAYYYYLVKSTIKNSIMLPIEVIIMVILFQALLPKLKQMNLIETAKTKISFF
ncbi:folate family ECF transporter S component [Paludicola sp. MB14-C6]|uniref:folate family ECF transporter S component n=1 Tax=Paludihabitans sp. MB14-C6 TaxID=3070656 RepID=UPI0027DC91EE|nr:folate family ECF transporter S component [Paludicola sp. MB14-C6]WMJ21877.1 folate family ECF transporter S component [Paludicola sp. MB14-C6]